MLHGNFNTIGKQDSILELLLIISLTHLKTKTKYENKNKNTNSHFRIINGPDTIQLEHLNQFQKMFRMNKLRQVGANHVVLEE